MEENWKQPDEENLSASETRAAETVRPAYLHEEFYTMLRELHKMEKETGSGRDVTYYLRQVEEKDPLCGQWVRHVDKILKLEDSIDGKNVFSFISECFEKRKAGEFQGMEGPQSQIELCRKIRIKTTTYTMRKTNNTSFSRREILAIVAAINIPPEYAECLYWISRCPMDVNDPFYQQLMKSVYHCLEMPEKAALKERLPWLEPLVEPDRGSRGGSPQTVDFWDILEEIRAQKKLAFVSIMPEGMSEVNWHRYKRNRRILGLHDILRCCIKLKASIRQTSRLLSSSGYTLPDVEESRSAKELMQQILDFHLHLAGQERDHENFELRQEEGRS